MQRLTLADGADPFEVTLREATTPTRIVLFGVGRGGDPQRHLPLLDALVDRGCTVIAPHFARLPSLVPDDDELLLRARRMRLALDHAARPGVPVAGVGHSMGASVLLALAGARMWMRPPKPLAIDPDGRLERLGLLAPATGFFNAPGALADVTTPLQVWAGSADTITPPAQSLALRDALAGRVPVELHVAEGAGHFTFMHVPPPGTTEPHPDRDGFLAAMTVAVGRFIAGR